MATPTKPKRTELAVKILILMVVSGLALTTAAPLSAATDTKSKTETLFSLLQKANATVTEILDNLKTKGVTIPQTSLNNHQQAITLANEAENLLQTGNYQEASGKTLQALQKLKETLRTAHSTTDEQPTPIETNTERANRIRSAISRLEEQLQQLTNLANAAPTAGYNTSTIDPQIENAKELVKKATNYLDQKNLASAERNLAQAKTIIDNLVSYANSLASNLKTQRLATYITQTEIRLSTIEDNAVQQRNTAALLAVSRAQIELCTARDYLANQQINQALAVLAESKTSELQAVSYLKPTMPSNSTSPSSTVDLNPTATTKSP